ncbi:hypothetical protein ACWGH3_39245 [Streptomyces sp. NPDC054884]
MDWTYRKAGRRYPMGDQTSGRRWQEKVTPLICDQERQDMAARNSEALDVLLRIAGDDRVTWRAVKIAGRGISADAAATLWMLADGKESTPGLELADKLMRQGELVDELVELWELFGRGETASADFEAGLEEIVRALERWPAS